MIAQHILIVEDEENIAEVLIAYCQQQGFSTKHLDSGKDVVNLVKQNHFDLILLDLMLPEVDGISLCRQIREFSNIAIIMITAKSAEIERLQGLELGADDYICKPFSPKEVIARIKAVLRRTQQSKANVIKYAGFELYKDEYVALLQGKNLSFTAVEFKIFLLFINQVGRVFSREDIINNVYNQNIE